MRLAVQFLAEPGDECAPVCDIDVVRACSERCFRNAVVLALERARAVDDDLRRSRAQPGGEICGGKIELQVAACPASRGEDFDPRIAAKRAADADAEISAAAQDDDARSSHARE
jgi:hypothetical protein